MSDDKFKPKGKEDFVSDLSEKFPNLDSDTVEKLAEREYTSHKNMGGALKQKDNQRQRKEFYKNFLKDQGYTLDEDGNPVKKGNKPKTQKGNLAKVSVEDMAFFFSQGGTRTALRKLRAIMAGTGKSFDDAMKDSLFTAFQKQNQADKKRRGAQLSPSRGGKKVEKEEPKTAEEKDFLKAMGVKGKDK